MITHHPSLAGTSAELPRQDARVAELAAGELHRSSYLDLRGVRCSCREGVLTLRGRLHSFYLKQVAQTLVRELPDVRRVENDIEVAPGPANDSARTRSPSAGRRAS